MVYHMVLVCARGSSNEMTDRSARKSLDMLLAATSYTKVCLCVSVCVSVFVRM